MRYSGRPAKQIFVYGLFFLVTLFFGATAEAQFVGSSDLVIQPDGKILLYGNGAVWRVDQNGIPDASFSYSSSNFAINSVVVQSNGKIIVAGSFPNPSNGVRGALVRRLNSDGTVDSTFTELYIPGTLSPAVSVATVWAVQADDKIIVSTEITAFGQYYYEVSRLNKHGGVDIAIQVSAGGLQSVSVITRVAMQPDGKILVITRFAIGASGSSVRRYNQNGTRDSSFTSPRISSTSTSNYLNLNDIIAGADGGIFIGGSFQKVNSVDRNNLAKLQATGSLDTAFTSPLGLGAVSGNSGDEVRRIAFAPNNRIIISTANRLIRLNPNGTIDTTFNPPNTITQINAFRVNSTGGVVFIGTVIVNGSATTKLWRLNADGSLDDTFDVRRPPFDFDGDGKSDVAVFRPSNGSWYMLRSADNTFYAVQFGQAGDKIAPADYDGDGKTDIAVFREAAFAYFYILNSSDNSFRFAQFGTTGDVPVSGDWDADGKADLAVYREAATSNFYYRPTAQPSVDYHTLPLGTQGDKPVRGDFDGDGRLDPTVYRPSNSSWIILKSSLNQISTTVFGLSTDIPTPADYDGDGTTNIAVFRPSTGIWYTSTSAANNYGAIPFGANGDTPVPTDYDGDGRADTAVFRPATGAWYLNRTTSGFTGIAFGASEDKPIPNAFIF